MQRKLIKSLCAMAVLIALPALSNGLHADPSSAQNVSERSNSEMDGLNAYVILNKPRLAHLKRRIAARKADLEQEAAELDSRKANIDDERRTLDRRDRASLEAFNEVVDDYNAEHRAYQRDLDAYDDMVVDYNERVNVLNEKQRRLDRLSDMTSVR